MLIIVDLMVLKLLLLGFYFDLEENGYFCKLFLNSVMIDYLVLILLSRVMKVFLVVVC